MKRSLRLLMVVLFSFVLLSSFFMGGCTRYAKEEQLTTLDETEASAAAAEAKVAEMEQEKAALEQKLEEKQGELEKVQLEKEKIQAKVAE